MRRRRNSGAQAVNRRDFFKGAGTGLLASGLAGVVSGDSASAKSWVEIPAGFLPSEGLSQIFTNLFLLRDTCNVYILKNGDRALLIDFGSGHVLELLGQIGITKVDGILHTHHHRDQCQGDQRAVAERIPIHVPAHERDLFEDAENFWRNRRVFHLYNVRNDFFSLTRNVPVSGVLLDYEKFRWGGYEFVIMECIARYSETHGPSQRGSQRRVYAYHSRELGQVKTTRRSRRGCRG